jgi:RNA-directed DNA polymerase
MNDEKSEQEEFLHRVGSEHALREAWRQLNKTNPDSFGLSGETISEFKKDLDAKIPTISQQILTGKYKFSKNRASLIPKENGKLRPLQIPEIKDRLVLKSLAIQIERELNSKLKKSKGVSFAYQKGIGIQDAMKTIQAYYDEGYLWVLEADIVNFFDKVEKRRLLAEFVNPDIPNSPIVHKLIERGLSQKIDLSNIANEDLHYFQDIKGGIPQGNPLSPLFSNIYLQSFDSYMIDQGYKLIRYADDFIVMLKSEDEAKGCFHKVRNYLKENLELELHPLGTKSRIIQPDKDALSFLSITFDGKHMFPSGKNFARFKESINKLCYTEQVSRTVLEILQRVRNALDGWLSSYFFTDVDRYFTELDTHINRQLYLALSRKDWKFNNRVIGKMQRKYTKRDESRDCLSDTQRKFSGIPFCKTIIEERRAQQRSNIE